MNRTATNKKSTLSDKHKKNTCAKLKHLKKMFEIIRKKNIIFGQRYYHYIIFYVFCLIQFLIYLVLLVSQ